MPAENKRQTEAPPLEWIAAGIGLLLLLGLLIAVAREALDKDSAHPPTIELRLGRIVHSSGGYIALVSAVNRSGDTAAAVTIEGTLKRPDGSTVETSTMTLDYVPSGGVTEGGLIFSEDPTRHGIKVRALGYQVP